MTYSQRFNKQQKHRAHARKPRAVRLAVEALEDRLARATAVWDGGSLVSSGWSDAANWRGDVAPLAGDDLVFPDGAARISNVNDLAVNTIINSLEFNHDYTISGNRLTLGAGGIAVHSGHLKVIA